MASRNPKQHQPIYHLPSTGNHKKCTIIVAQTMNALLCLALYTSSLAWIKFSLNFRINGLPLIIPKHMCNMKDDFYCLCCIILSFISIHRYQLSKFIKNEITMKDYHDQTVLISMVFCMDNLIE